MQAIAPVTHAQLLATGQDHPLLKFEIFYGCCWVDLTDLGGKNYLKKGSLSISTGGAEMTPNPVAGSWSVVIFNKDGMFDPDEPDYAPYNEYFKAGRKVKISVGAKYNGVDYYWRRIYGFMEIPKFSIGKKGGSEVNLSGFDNMQFLTDTKLRMPNNYWGSDITKSTFASEETLGAELYNEADAMDILGEVNTVANWTIIYHAGMGSVADPAPPGGTWGGEIKKDAGWGTGYREVYNIDNVEQGKEYKVNFWYYKSWALGPLDELSVGIYKTGTVWTGTTAKVVGDTVEPTIAKTNNCFYRCTVAGNTDNVEPVWPIVENGGIVDGTVTWATQYMDGKKMGEITDLTSAIYVEKSFYFTATESCAIKMRLTVTAAGADQTEFMVDLISIKEVTGSSNAGYNLPDECNGPYYVTLDGEPIYYRDEGAGWYYESATKRIFIENGRVLIVDQSLKVYYFTTQIPENVVADLLVTAGLYDTQAEALAAMIYTATGITIDQTWFKKGESAINAVRMLCERCNYRFYFNYGERPVFMPAPTSSNLLTDGGLNIWTTATNLTYWAESIAGGSTVNREAVDKIEGTYSARLDVDPGDSVVDINQSFSMIPDKKYKIIAWYMNSLAGKTSQIIIVDSGFNVYLKSDGTWGGVDSILLPNSLIWEKYELKFSAHPDYSNYKVYLRRHTAAASSIYFDNLSIWKEDFTFTESHIVNIRDYEDRNEIRNRIVIEGRKEAQPIGPEETMPSELKGEASEVASINKYGEHTWSMKNHLFQDQVTIDAYAAIYLAAFKDPKWYTTFDTPFNPVPLEKGDTDTWRKQYEVGGTPIDQRGIIRDIQINDFTVTYKNEKVA